MDRWPPHILVEVVTLSGRRSETWRVRPPSAREALAVVTLDLEDPGAASARLRPIIAAWWPLSMCAALFALSVEPAVPLAAARWLVAQGVPERPPGAGDADADAESEAADWDLVAVEVRAVVGLTLDEPWADWIRAAWNLDKIRARLAMTHLAWYAAAKSGDDKAWRQLARRAGYETDRQQTPEEGLANMRALRSARGA